MNPPNVASAVSALICGIGLYVLVTGLWQTRAGRVITGFLLALAGIALFEYTR